MEVGRIFHYRGQAGEGNRRKGRGFTRGGEELGEGGKAEAAWERAPRETGI